MTRAELEAALAECEGHTPGPWRNVMLTLIVSPAWDGSRILANIKMGKADARDFQANARLIALAPALASALREAWKEIDRLQAEVKRYDAVQECNKYPLDEALNSGTGDYKP